MKNKRGKLMSLILAVALLVPMLLIASPAAAFGPPMVVAGRILPPTLSGDVVNWIEVARYGNYSLIVRSSYLNWYPQPGYYNNARWQYVPYGSQTSYLSSHVYNKINDWFNCMAPLFADNLSPYARLRQFTMDNNARVVTGTSSTWAGMMNGFSLPMPTQRGYGHDIAFALSFSEAANYISTQSFVRDRMPATDYSNFAAIMNFGRLNMPAPNFALGEFSRGMWLRSTGDLKGTMGAMAKEADRGRVFQFYIDKPSEECGMLYPALWVDAGVFSVNYPTVVNYYKDSISPTNFLGSNALLPAPVGSTIAGVDLTAFCPTGYTTPGTRSGDTVVREGGSVVNVLYTRTTYTTVVNYYKDSISTTNLLGSVPLPPAAAGTPIDNVDLTLHAPAGYTVPGTRSGDTVVREGGSTVNVLYTQGKYPTTVYFYRDSLDKENMFKHESLPPAAAGTIIDIGNLPQQNVPAGYAPIFERSGDVIVSARDNSVHIVYTQKNATSTVYVFYYKDYIGSVLLGSDLLKLDVPAGTPITGLDLTKYRPAGYNNIGVATGDKNTADPFAIVFVCYTMMD